MMKTIWQYRKLIVANFLAALGVCTLVWEVVLLLVQYLADDKRAQLVAGIIILILSIGYSLWGIFHKRSELTLEVKKRTKLIIKPEDLMTASGLRVIPVNEYFDTHNGDGIINPKSLHGQFLSKFDDRIDWLRKEIDKQLASKESLPSNRVRTMVDGLPQTRYPLGTCIRIMDGEDSYLLLALTRFNADEHVDVASEEYPEVIRKMFNGIENLNNGNPVYMPLVGSGIAGYQLTPMQMLDTIAQAAHNADKLAVTNGITVCLYGEEQIKSINLNVIEYLYDRWKALK